MPEIGGHMRMSEMVDEHERGTLRRYKNKIILIKCLIIILK